MAGKKQLTEERVNTTIKLARYILTTRSSLRITGKIFNMRKSTVQYYISNYLPLIKPDMAKQVQKILASNFSISYKTANDEQLLNKARRKQKITDYITDRILTADVGEAVLIKQTDISNATNISRSTVCQLIQEILDDEDCNFKLIKTLDKNIIKHYYKLKDE